MLFVATGAAALGGAALTAYATWEARVYTLRRVEVPVLPAGARPVRVLVPAAWVIWVVLGPLALAAGRKASTLMRTSRM